MVSPIGKKGKEHLKWVDGNSPEYYRRIGFEIYGRKCSVCNSKKNLEIHHKDKNRHNSDINNLTVVCCSCHRKIHKIEKNFNNAWKNEKRDNQGKFYSNLPVSYTKKCPFCFSEFITLCSNQKYCNSCRLAKNNPSHLSKKQLTKLRGKI